MSIVSPTQELLLILEDHWNRSPDLQGVVPIYSASGLASQSLKVYQTYIEMMNDAIKQAFQVSFVINRIALCSSPSLPNLSTTGATADLLT